MVNFIGEYSISPTLCDQYIDFFEANKSLQKVGKVGYRDDYGKQHPLSYRPEIKDSIDVNLGPESNTADIPIVNDYMHELYKCIRLYVDEYPEVDTLPNFSPSFPINIQKYNPGGGFKTFHFERNVTDYTRCLVFMTYLNTVNDKGGTEFKYQELTASPVKGKTLVWPADWTHTHRGIPSPTETKYILTGWICNYKIKYHVVNDD